MSSTPTNLRYFAHYSIHTDSWHVVYRRATGSLMSVLDVGTEAAADREAWRMNRQAKSARAQIKRSQEHRAIAGFYTGQGDL